jgi:hypothetical protein
MKKILKKSGYIFLITSLFFTSCLKDESITLDTSLSNSVTEFANTGSIVTNPSNGAPPRFIADLGTLAVGDEVTFNVNVDYAGAKTASQDITVTVDIDESLLTTYNTEHSVDGANYIMAPDGVIESQFPMTITIPKGEVYGQAQVKIKLTSDYDFGVTYAVPLKITSTSVGDISGNFGTALYSLNVRNAYDGVYYASGHMTHPSYGGDYEDKEEDMVTIGANSVEFQLQTTVLFAVYIDLDVDPVTNLVTITSSSVVLDPYDPAKNYYDPSTKTFHLDFGYSGDTRHITMTAVYSGPR